MATSNGGRTVGGVGAQQAKRRLAPPLSPAHGDLIWNGGPVLTTLDLYPMFWGSNWSDADHLAQATRLVQFLTDLLASDYMNILTQYGVNAGGQVRPASFVANVGSSLTDSAIQTTIQNMINAGTISEPPSNNTTQALVVFLDESVAVDDTNFGVVMCEPSGDNAFGYHSGFATAAGNNCYYSIIPDLDDACIQNSCPTGNCSLSPTLTQEQRRTQVTSHEIAEMATDPGFNTGWFGQSSDEIGDICNGLADSITVGTNTWNIQRMYSKTDDIATNGGNYCLTGAPAPIPLLPGGPPSQP